MPLTDRTELLKLLTARHASVSVVTYEEDHALQVVRDACLQSRRQLLVWDCVNGLRDGLIKDAVAFPDTVPCGGALAWIEKHPRGDAIFCLLDAADEIEKDPSVRRMLRDAVNRLEREGGTLVFIDSREPPSLVRSLSSSFELSYPNNDELESIVRETTRSFHQSNKPVRVDLRKKDLQAIVSNLRGLTRRQARQAVLDAIALDQKLDATDAMTVLGHKRRVLGAGGLLQSVDAPTDLDDIGGLDRMKAWLAARDAAHSQEAIDYGLEPPKGLLLLGVQGAGKSLASKAVATAWNRPLLRLDVSSLYDRYIGESERKLREALTQSEMMSPCILWIDEVEKAFAGAAAQSNDGGLSRRMFGALLTWMQERSAPVFLIATANDVSALPPELLRKGRFDEIFFVDLPGHAARAKIFDIHLSKRKRDVAKFDLGKLVAVSEGYSGAEIEQAIVSAMYVAFGQKREVTTEDIVETVESSPPLSVTRREQVAELRAWAKDRCVPAE
jgi:AAA+ superfamily predicted ATPase